VEICIIKVCDECKGSGKVIKKISNKKQIKDNLPRFMTEKCETCKGEGYVKIHERETEKS